MAKTSPHSSPRHAGPAAWRSSFYRARWARSCAATAGGNESDRRLWPVFGSTRRGQCASQAVQGHPDVQDARLEVDIPPAQPQRLALRQAHCEGHGVECLKAITLGGVEELPRLRPDALLNPCRLQPAAPTRPLSRSRPGSDRRPAGPASP